ncbi:hypothetical protein [Dyella sp. C9]|uniref:hypothetical protein n=1 Tax=Dyella sp. C9 TaxID=2202154 RepID=UPI000DEEF215|nr:hypothetical protein [Dyella sp. C9]
MLDRHTTPVRDLVRVLDTASLDGLSAAQASLAGFALQCVVANLADDRLDRLSAILQSVADVLSEGAVSPALAYLLGLATEEALVQLDNLP